MRERKFSLWDSRDLSKPLTTNTLDSSTGVVVPLYDNDARILYLAGKVRDPSCWRFGAPVGLLMTSSRATAPSVATRSLRQHLTTPRCPPQSPMLLSRASPWYPSPTFSTHANRSSDNQHALSLDRFDPLALIPPMQLPKRALNVMECEVERLLKLTQDDIIPVTYEVPRKVRLF